MEDGGKHAAENRLFLLGGEGGRLVMARASQRESGGGGVSGTVSQGMSGTSQAPNNLHW